MFDKLYLACCCKNKSDAYHLLNIHTALQPMLNNNILILCKMFKQVRTSTVYLEDKRQCAYHIIRQCGKYIDIKILC